MIPTVLVTGGRDFNDREMVKRALDRVTMEFGKPRMLIHGAARGADTLAGEWAVRNDVPVCKCPADWDKYKGRPGKNPAGAIRNSEMLAKLPEVVVAFPGGSGTADMVGKVIRAGYRSHCKDGYEVFVSGGRPR